MALPKISHPIYELELPSTKEKVKYRPFLVKEEKLLLMAQSGEDTIEIVNTIKQVINNCILSDNVDVNKMSSFDLEYFFIQLRSKSIGNIIKVSYRDLDDDKKYDFEINLDEVNIVFKDNHNKQITINKTTGMFMTYPSVDASASIVTSAESEALFELIGSCIDYIYDENGTYNPSEYTTEEVMEFISSLNIEAFQQVQDFFATMPSLYYELKYTNSLGTEKTIELTTLNDFFTLG